MSISSITVTERMQRTDGARSAWFQALSIPGPWCREVIAAHEAFVSPANRLGSYLKQQAHPQDLIERVLASMNKQRKENANNHQTSLADSESRLSAS